MKNWLKLSKKEIKEKLKTYKKENLKELKRQAEIVYKEELRLVKIFEETPYGSEEEQKAEKKWYEASMVKQLMEERIDELERKEPEKVEWNRNTEE